MIEEDRRIGRPVPNMIVGAHRAQCLEPVLVSDTAELGNIRRPVRRTLESEHVQGTNNRERDSEQVWPLRDSTANRDATGASAKGRQLVFGGVLLVDQVFGASDEIFPGVGLATFLTGPVPLISVYPAASNVGGGQPEPVFQEYPGHGLIAWFRDDAVRSITREQDWVRAIRFEILRTHDRQRYERAVIAFH